MTDSEWLKQFLDKLQQDPGYIDRLRANADAAIHEIADVPPEIEENLQNGEVFGLPANADDCEAIRIWLEALLKLLGSSRWHFMLK